MSAKEQPDGAVARDLVERLETRLSYYAGRGRIEEPKNVRELHCLAQSALAALPALCAEVEAQALRIAKQDATIARMFTREQVAELLRGMVPAAYTATDYLKGYVDDAEATGHNDFRTETLARIEAWQNQEQVK